MLRTLTALSVTLALGTAAPAGAATRSTHESETRIATVVKVRGLSWFERMRDGIEQFAARAGIDVTFKAAADASPVKQVRLVRRLIAQRPDAITVVPNSPAALERVLARARRAGIVVVTHEASNQRNTDVDIEAFDNTAFGAHLMDKLAACMGGGGSYVAFVGHRSARSHMEWVRGAKARAEARYPAIERIGGPIESLEDEETAYLKAKAVLAEHPDVEGFESSSAVSIAGIARAIREAGRQGTTCVMGTSSPRTVGDYLFDGSVDTIFLWDPAIAGKAQYKLALRLLAGRRVGPGLDLHLPGYRDLRKIPDSPHGLRGSAWIDVDRFNADRYPF